MLIALDYDQTYTADPEGWNAVVELMTARGHSFVCVTGRTEPPGTDEPHIPMPVVCAGDRMKSSAAHRAGYHVDVWIDDCPSTIEQVRLSDF
ncbi:hypothetical protein [Nevskia sp.]|uniref:hypothetical protein n=1 Tax=Nevskia sp. TaxID=1929292 RepID=UPI0025FF6CC3|nr:hypothetical protein [Nevskia sp.]